MLLSLLPAAVATSVDLVSCDLRLLGDGVCCGCCDTGATDLFTVWTGWGGFKCSAVKNLHVYPPTNNNDSLLTDFLLSSACRNFCY